MRILIVDDHQIVLRGVRQILEGAQWEICGEAENGKVAVEKVQQLKPDVVVLDISMPVMNGYEAARQIKSISPSTVIVILTMHEGSTVESVMKGSQADAYVAKSEAEQQLVKAIRKFAPSSHRGRPNQAKEPIDSRGAGRTGS